MATRRTSLARVHLTGAVLLLCIVTQGACPGFLGFNWGGGPGEPQQPPNDCLPLGPALCGPIWDTDGDTISTNSELNTTNNTGYGGFYTFDITKWDINESQARGTPTNGTLYKGINLTDDGTGYLHHTGCDFVDEDDWGTGHLVRLIEGAGRWWLQFREHATAMQVGDLSLKSGGFFGGRCLPNHDSHRNGVDADIRYLRKDHLEGPLNICTEAANYDTVATIQLLNSFLDAEMPTDANAHIEAIFVDMDCVGIPAKTVTGRTLLFHDPNHQDHFHVRIQDPDGPYN